MRILTTGFSLRHRLYEDYILRLRLHFKRTKKMCKKSHSRVEQGRKNLNDVLTSRYVTERKRALNHTCIIGKTPRKYVD